TCSTGQRGREGGHLAAVDLFPYATARFYQCVGLVPQLPVTVFQPPHNHLCESASRPYSHGHPVLAATAGSRGPILLLLVENAGHFRGDPSLSSRFVSLLSVNTSSSPGKGIPSQCKLLSAAAVPCVDLICQMVARKFSGHH